MSGLGWLGALCVLGGGLTASGLVWQVLHPPRPAGWRERARPPARAPLTSLGTGWLALTGVGWSAHTVRQVRRGGALGLGLLAGLLTQNVLVGGAWAGVGWLAPEVLLRLWARRRWRQLDTAAFGATHMLRAKLDRGLPVLVAWRQLLPEADPIFRDWMQPCLMAEARGAEGEATLKQQAQAIGHVELTALADILAAERAQGHTAAIVQRLTDLWAQRIRADAVRRGTLAANATLGYGLVAGGLGLFGLLWLGRPAFRLALTHGATYWMAGVGLSVIVLAGALQTRVSRHAEGGW